MRLCRPESTTAVYQRSTIVPNSAKRVKSESVLQVYTLSAMFRPQSVSLPAETAEHQLVISFKIPLYILGTYVMQTRSKRHHKEEIVFHLQQLSSWHDMNLRFQSLMD